MLLTFSIFYGQSLSPVALALPLGYSTRLYIKQNCLIRQFPLAAQTQDHLQTNQKGQLCFQYLWTGSACTLPRRVRWSSCLWGEGTGHTGQRGSEKGGEKGLVLRTTWDLMILESKQPCSLLQFTGPWGQSQQGEEQRHLEVKDDRERTSIIWNRWLQFDHAHEISGEIQAVLQEDGWGPRSSFPTSLQVMPCCCSQATLWVVRIQKKSFSM